MTKKIIDAKHIISRIALIILKSIEIKEAPDLQWITTKVFGICIYANRSC